MLARYSAIKTNQCTGTGKWSCNVLLISEDTGTGSVGVWPRRSSSLVRSSAQHNWAVAASCCSPTIFLLRYTPTCNIPPQSPIHSLSLSRGRLTVTVCGPLIPVPPLSCECRSKKLSSCLSLGSTLGGKLERYIKTMWARLVYVCLCVACVVVSTFTWIR